MNNILLVTRPRYDNGTEYLSYYASLIIKEAEDCNLQVKDFKDQGANKQNVVGFIEKKNPKLVFVNGHGGQSCLCGNNDEIIFSLENVSLLKERIIYARACSAGAVLGAKLSQNNIGCFIGYTSPFQFWMDQKWSAKPSNDNIARLYLQPSNEVVSSIIQGKTSKEANEKSKNMMLDNMREILKLEEKKEPGAMGMLQVLWNNYEGQVLLGNPDAKI